MRRGRTSRVRRHVDERGQATVELALVLPVVVLVAMIVVQAGLVATDSLLVHHAAREAARAAAVEPTPAAARAAAIGSTRLDPGRLTVVLSGSAAEGEIVRATVRYRSPTALPLVGRFVGDVDLSATVAILVE